jgi:hypothetical protein
MNVDLVSLYEHQIRIHALWAVRVGGVMVRAVWAV